MPTIIDETELARLVAKACRRPKPTTFDELRNAVHALVAEVRRLREALNKEHRAWQCADARGDYLEMENAVLREKVEEWEWLEEVRAYSLDVDHPYQAHKYANPFKENRAKAFANASFEWIEMLYAAREAVHADRE